jgi:hypothetical protein
MEIGRCRKALGCGFVRDVRILSAALTAHIACHGALSASANGKAYFDKPSADE